MTGDCKDCGFWSRTSAGGPRGKRGSCHLHATDGPFGVPRAAAAISVNGQGTAYLLTAPDFGCKSFRAKLLETNAG